MMRLPVPIPLAATCLLAALPGSAAAALDAGVAGPDYRLAQLFIQQRVVVKVRRPPPPAPDRAAPPVRWMEKKGPKCLPLDGFAGAAIIEPDAIDLVAADGNRYRARLDEDCSSLDFYSNFYFKPTRDGRVCADRDALHSRAGRSCAIEGFRRLVAKR